MDSLRDTNSTQTPFDRESVLTLCYVLAASYLVLRFEYEEGGFLYYFFKSKLYYANINKIILPVYFWFCSLLYMGGLVLAQKTGWSREKIFHFLRHILFFHLFLLLLSHSEEITPGFALMPPHFSLLPHITQYEQAFMQVGFIAYYTFSFHIFKKSLCSRNESFERAVPLSLVVPFLFLNHPWIHLLYFAIALGILLIIKMARNFSFHSPNPWMENRWALPGIIFLIGLCLRLWYAYHLSLYPDNTVGFSADGPAYYQSALAFADGNFDHVLYWNAPFYSYYLSWFLELFGRAPETIFFSQAILGSFIPVLVYLIVKNFSDRVTAAVAGLLIAVSSLAIHFSVVIQRATGQILVFSLLVYICLTLIRSIKTYKFFFLGMLLCAGFYLGQETLPTLLVFLIVSMCLVVKKEIQLSGIMQKTLWTLAGAFLAMLPLNLIYFGQSGRWLPLGRDLTQGGSAEGWALANSPSAQALDSMGFNPWRSVGESLGVFFSQPLKTVSLLLGKFLDELPGFLFDPGNIFIYPLRLSGESFFGAGLQFYIYFFTAAGLIIFVWSRRIAPFVKILILFPIGWQLLMDSVLLYGTFRYRAPVTSLNMILTAHALKPFLFSSKVKRDEPAIASSLSEGTMAKDRMGNLRRQWLILSSAGLLVIVSLFILISERDISSPTKPDLKTEVTPWSLLDGQQLKATNAALINRTVFAFYKSQRENPFNATITFNMCRFLMPGWKPYYRLAVNGRFISEPKKIAHGCSETSASFDLPQKEGIINLYIYVSDTGETADPVPQQVTTKKIVTQWGREIQSIFIPLVPGLGLDKGLRRKIELFNHYSWGFVKISPVVFSKKPNAS